MTENNESSGAVFLTKKDLQVIQDGLLSLRDVCKLSKRLRDYECGQLMSPDDKRIYAKAASQLITLKGVLAGLIVTLEGEAESKGFIERKDMLSLTKTLKVNYENTSAVIDEFPTLIRPDLEE